jgi:hypothetical protein
MGVSACISALSALVSIGALIYVGLQFNALKDQNILDTESNQKQATTEFISNTLAKLQEFYRRLPPTDDKRALRKFIKKAGRRGSKQYFALRDYLNYLEDLSAGVNLGTFEKKSVRQSIGGRMIRAWIDYHEWMLTRRGIVPPYDLYIELQRSVEAFEPKLTRLAERYYESRGIQPPAPGIRLSDDSL